MRPPAFVTVAAFLAAALLTAGCASPALEYARAHHPGCAVVVLDNTGDAVTVEVTCPGAEPVERTYRAR